MKIFYIVLFVFPINGSLLKVSYPPSIYPPGPCNLKSTCRQINCPAVVCPYGNDPLACSCCPTCLKGPGDSCGGKNNENGRCAKDHICVDELYQPIDETYGPVGYCRSRFCPNCAKVVCDEPGTLRCEGGIIKDSFCGCCPACKKGLNEDCGGPFSIKGACPRNEALLCKNENSEEIFPEKNTTQVGKCEYGDGLIIPDSTKSKRNICEACATGTCSYAVKCTYGSETDPFCSCCQRCKKGLNGSCGGEGNLDGTCGDEFVCENSICVPKSTKSKRNICEACATGTCSYAVKCTYGSETDPICPCCQRCKKGLNGSCGGEGNLDGTCGDEFVCENSICVPKSKKQCSIDCRFVRCKSPESLGCPNNYTTLPCKCCPECI